MRMPQALARRGIGGLVLASALAMSILLIAIGAFALSRAGALHQKIADVTSRDVTPLADLRLAQDTANQVTILGLVASSAPDPAVVQLMTKNRQTALDAMGGALDRMVADTPAELRGHAQDLVAGWEAFRAADEAYRQGAAGPNAAQLNKTAADLFNTLGADFGAQADRLVADAMAQKEQVDAEYATLLTTTVVTIAAGALIALVTGSLIAGSIRRRTGAILAATDRLAGGDFTDHALPVGEDELGRMAASLNHAAQTLKQMIGSVASNAETLRGSSDHMDGVSSELAQSSEAAGSRAQAVAAVAGRVSVNVQTLAAASEQMMASVAEISRNAADAAKVAQSAVTVAGDAGEVVTRLSDSSREITSVIKLITSIAQQTNLLALNATIEASRAGDAGKGFAVVAGEVKELAQETARATDDISRQIQSVQTDAERAVTTIDQIGEVIGQINDYAASIASAVEEQTATTSEMARNITAAADGVTEIASGAADVTNAVESTGGLVSQSRAASSELASMSNGLTEMVGAFRYR